MLLYCNTVLTVKYLTTFVCLQYVCVWIKYGMKSLMHELYFSLLPKMSAYAQPTSSSSDTYYNQVNVQLIRYGAKRMRVHYVWVGRDRSTFSGEFETFKTFRHSFVPLSVHVNSLSEMPKRFKLIAFLLIYEVL